MDGTNEKTRRRPGGRYALTALLLLAMFALAGALSVALTQRFGLTLDLTENRLYTLSERTKQIVAGLEEPVTVTVMNSEPDFPLLPRGLLASYGRCGEKLSVVYCDPYREPRTVQAYTQMGLDVELNDLIVQAGDRVRQIKLTDLYELSSDGAQVERLAAEQQITSAIHQVTSGDRAAALFSDGHGERPSASLMELFEANQYAPSYATISVLGLDPEAAVFVICAPERDFSREDIDLVEDYLAGGGSVMVFAEPGMEQLPNLQAFLEDWGVRLTDGVVREPSLYVSGSESSVAATYASHEINAYFASNRYFVIVPSCMPLDQAFIRKGAIRTEQVLTSSAAAYSHDEQAQDGAGPYPLALTARRTGAAEGEDSGRLFVIGSRLVYGDDLLGKASLANRDFLTQAIAWCDDSEDLISIPSKEMTEPFLPIVAGQARTIAVVLTAALPLAILLAGGAVWLRRRYL